MEKAERLQIQNSAEGLVLSRENPASHQTDGERNEPGQTQWPIQAWAGSIRAPKARAQQPQAGAAGSWSCGSGGQPNRHGARFCCVQRLVGIWHPCRGQKPALLAGMTHLNVSSSLTAWLQGEQSITSRAASLQKRGILCFNFVLEQVKDSIKYPYIPQFFLYIFF